MKTFKTLAGLQQGLPELGEADASIALVCVRERFTVQEMAAVREAVRICDVCVVACLDAATRGAKLEKYLQKERVKALFLGGIPASSLEIKQDVLPVLQTVLAVMPSMVVVAAGQPELVQIFSKIEKTFTNLYVLRVQQVAEDVLEDIQKQTRKEVKTAWKKAGVGSSIAIFDRYAGEYLAKIGVKANFFVLDAAGERLTDKAILSKGKYAIGFCAEADQKKWWDGIIVH